MRGNLRRDRVPEKTLKMTVGKEKKMFVRKIRSKKGIIEVGRHGIDRIDVHEDNTATCYTAGEISFV